MAFDLEAYEKFVDDYKASKMHEAPPLYIWSTKDLCLAAIQKRANHRGYAPDDIRDDICVELRAAGFLTGRKHYKLTSKAYSRLHEVERESASTNNRYFDWADIVSDEASDKYFELFPREPIGSK